MNMCKHRLTACFYSVCLVIVYIGIFGYLNYLLPKTRKDILETLVNGLKRLEYRGYDSAGVAFDSDNILSGTSCQLQTE